MLKTPRLLQSRHKSKCGLLKAELITDEDLSQAGSKLVGYIHSMESRTLPISNQGLYQRSPS